jgi:uncharacterized protein
VLAKEPAAAARPASPKAFDFRASKDYSRGMDDATRTEVEAAAFRRLLGHLREHTEVQNVDLMNLAGFCRNCLAKWFRAEARARGADVSDEQARELVYGMPYTEWKAKHQTAQKP